MIYSINEKTFKNIASNSVSRIKLIYFSNHKSDLIKKNVLTDSDPWVMGCNQKFVAISLKTNERRYICELALLQQWPITTQTILNTRNPYKHVIVSVSFLLDIRRTKLFWTENALKIEFWLWPQIEYLTDPIITNNTINDMKQLKCKQKTQRFFKTIASNKN